VIQKTVAIDKAQVLFVILVLGISSSSDSPDPKMSLPREVHYLSR
jgi:hypothetical protein